MRGCSLGTAESAIVHHDDIVSRSDQRRGHLLPAVDVVTAAVKQIDRRLWLVLRLEMQAMDYGAITARETVCLTWLGGTDRALLFRREERAVKRTGRQQEKNDRQKDGGGRDWPKNGVVSLRLDVSDTPQL